MTETPAVTPHYLRSPSEERVWPYVIGVVLLPVLVLVRQSNPLFAPPGVIDSWVYLGFFRHLLNFKRDLFPNTYYGSRLSWILPGYVFHAILPPLVATCALHLSVLWTSLLSLFTTLRLTVGARRAFMTTLVCGVSPQLWYASGWDYLDGAVIAYCLLGVALLTRASLDPNPRGRLLLAGMALACMVYANLFWVTILPLPLLYYAVLAWRRSGCPVMGISGRLLLWTGAGFVIMTLVFCAVNYGIDGTVWFYEPSLRVAPGLTHNNPWYRSPWTHHGLRPWLWFPAIVVLVALVVTPGRLRAAWRKAAPPAPPLLLLLLLSAATILTFLQFQWHLAVLGLAYYSSGLLPLVFLGAGCLFFSDVDRISTRPYILLCGGAALVFGTIWSDYRGMLPIWPDAIWPSAGLIAALLAAGLMLRQPVAATALTLAGFACLTAEVRFIPMSQTEAEGRVPTPSSPHEYRDAFERAMSLSARIEAVRQGGPVRFWYNQGESASEDYTSLNAIYLYLMTRFPEPFPAPPCESALQPGSVIVASMGQRTAATALSGISPCANRSGLRASVASTFATQSPGGTYYTAILNLDRDPLRWHTLQVRTDPTSGSSASLAGYSSSGGDLPPAWSTIYPETGSTLQRTPAGLLLRTGRKAHTDAASYGPIVIPATGRYGFLLQCLPRAGNVVFGVVSNNTGNWLAAEEVRRPGSVQKLECWLDLQKGQTIQLRIANKTDVGVEVILYNIRAVEFDR